MRPTTDGEADRSESPERVARDAFQAMTEERWEDMVDLLDPADVEQFREQRVPVPGPSDSSAITAERLRKQDPELPMEVAEYRAEQMRKHLETSAIRDAARFGVGSIDELEGCSAPMLLTRYLRTNGPAARLQEMLREMAVQGEAISFEAARLAMPGPRFKVVGCIAEGDSTAHVVYRMILGGGSDPDGIEPDQRSVSMPPRLATLKRTPAGWRLKLASDLFGLEGLSFGFSFGEETDEC